MMVPGYTFVCSHGKIVKLREVTAMGSVFSPINAIVALLRVEHETRTTWVRSMFVISCPDWSDSILLGITCILDRRYIDDLYTLLKIDRRLITSANLLRIIEVQWAI